VLESRWYEIDDLRVHARVAAAGHMPVVLVHGIGVSSRYLVPLGEVLAPDFDVYVPDMPGFGRSDKPRDAPDVPAMARFLASIINAASIDRALFAGNSFGCQILAEFALGHPERMIGLVLQGPTIDPYARSALRQIVRWLRDGPREPRGIHLIFTLARDYLDCGFRRPVQLFRYALSDPIEDKLPLIRVPTVVVRGSRDSIVSQQWAEKAAESLPDGRLVVIPGAAHTINFGAPLELARIVRSVARRPELHGA
jgi:2-hydroxy-6-oxonona-2,4-dienedioate hydrolase